MDITPQTPVGEIVARHPAAARVFYQHEIDYCCGGRRSLAEACAARSASLETLLADLAAAVAGGEEEESDWQGLGPGDLCRYVVERFHVPLREELARLAGLGDKALAAHGATYSSWLPELRAVLADLHAELLAHMEKEERILFPFILQLETGEPDALPFPPAMIGGPIGAMEHEHDDAGRALARLRELSAGYRPPEDACTTVQALLQGLHQLEREMHQHVHLENEVLFPQALALAAAART